MSATERLEFVIKVQAQLEGRPSETEDGDGIAQIAVGLCGCIPEPPEPPLELASSSGQGGQGVDAVDEADEAEVPEKKKKKEGPMKAMNGPMK
eukprot:s12543_g1.t1